MRGRHLAGLTSVALAVAVTCTACSLVTSLDGLSGGPATVPRADGEPIDAASDANATSDARADLDGGSTDAGDEAGPNLEPNGTFETGTCDPWGGFQGTLDIVPTAHTGSGACRACTSPMFSAFTADDERSPGPNVVGATYHVEAWVRADPTAPAAQNVRLLLRNATFINGKFMGYEQNASDPVAIDATWRRLETTVTLTHAANVNAFLGGDAVPGACFLFDDVVLRRTN